MTYGRFLGLFLGVPILLTLWKLRDPLRKRWQPFPMWVLLAVVYATTSPWDNAAVKHGLWDFGAERIWGIRLGYLPLEEYLFFGLQTVLTGLWVWKRLLGVELPPAKGTAR